MHASPRTSYSALPTTRLVQFRSICAQLCQLVPLDSSNAVKRSVLILLLRHARLLRRALIRQKATSVESLLHA